MPKENPMSQLTDESVALGGDPVEQTDATEQAAPVEERYVETEAPDNAEQRDTTLEDLYPDEGPKPEPEEENPEVNDEAQAEPEDDEIPDEDAEPEDPAIERPKSWSKETEEEWSALPRNIQERIAERETERERFVNTKAQEAAQTENRVRQMAEQELAQFSEQQAMQYQMLAQQFFPKEPDDQLLYTGNPQDQVRYQQQQAEYRRGLAQQQQLQQAAQDHAQRAQRIRDDQDNAARQQDAERLRAEMPEWFDEEKHADLERELTAIASQFYPKELLPEANASDLLALKAFKELRDERDALQAQVDAFNKAKMKPVREAKNKRPPIPNTPGNPAASQKEIDPLKVQYPND